MLFAEWLEKTRELQRVWYDTDPQSLEGEARAEYVRWNVLAADHELHEFLDHIQWKPWSSRLGELRDRDDAVEELVDVLHFVANLLLVLGADGDELNAVYLAKMAKNSARQETGYDSFGKAEGAYEDPKFHYGHVILFGHESHSQIPICRTCNRDLTDDELLFHKAGVACRAPRCELASHDESTPHLTDGVQWSYTADLTEERHAEEAAGRESVRHPATRHGRNGREQWNTTLQCWETLT